MQNILCKLLSASLGSLQLPLSLALRQQHHHHHQHHHYYYQLHHHCRRCRQRKQHAGCHFITRGKANSKMAPTLCRASEQHEEKQLFPAPSPKGSLLILHAAKRKYSPSSPGHLIIVILLVMLCGSCLAAWLASCQQFSCCLFAFTPGQREAEEEGEQGEALCVAGRVHAAYAYCSRCQQLLLLLLLHPCEA